MAVLLRSKSMVYGLVTDLATINSNIGTLASLETTAKTSLVAAINELANGGGSTQVELDATQVGAGLSTDGTYVANGSTTYISTATSLANADALLDAAVGVNTDGVATNAAAIAAETTRATDAEAVLQDAIDAEELARTNADSELTTNLNAEITRATAAETALTDSLNVEITRATTAEGVLQSNIDTETTDRIAGDTALQTALDAEVTRATAAEATLTTNLAAEVTRATAAEAALTASLDSEITRATAAEATLTANLATEVTRATTAEAAIAADLQTEITRALAAETALDDAKVDLAGDSMLGNLDFGGLYKVTGLAAPTSDYDATTKVYVDSLISGLDWKDSVRVATTANLDLATGGLQTIDGIAVVEGDRVLVKDQTDSVENGIYEVRAGAWVRTADFDDSPDTEVTAGNAVFIEEGTKYVNSGWVLQGTGNLTVDTDELVFTQFTSLGQIIAGAGIVKDGNELYLQFGAGVKELPTDEIGLDLYSSAGLQMVDPDLGTPSTASEAQLALKLNDSDLEVTSLGLAITQAFKDSLTSNTDALQAALDAEESARIAADSTLTADLAAEVTRATAAETSIAANLDTEITRATTAEATLTSNLNTEITRATAAEATLQAAIDAETTARTDADTVLSNSIAAEVTRATAAEGVIAADLATEVTRATDAESVLQSNIDNESAARISSDSALQTALDAEVTARTDGDAVLTAGLSDLSGVTDTATARTNLDVYSTSETDEAIRLGGAIFVTETLTVASDTVVLSQTPKNGVVFNFGTVRHVDVNGIAYDIPVVVTGTTGSLSPDTAGQFDGKTVTIQYAYIPTA